MAGGQPRPAMAISPSVWEQAHWTSYLLSLHKTVIQRMITCIAADIYVYTRELLCSYTCSTELPTILSSLFNWQGHSSGLYASTHTANGLTATMLSMMPPKQPPGLHKGFPSWHLLQKHTTIAAQFLLTNGHFSYPTTRTIHQHNGSMAPPVPSWAKVCF